MNEWGFQDVLRAVQSLKQDERFCLFVQYLQFKLNASREDLETADQNFRQSQGRVAMLRELTDLIENAKETSELLGQSGEKSDPGV